MNSVTNGMEDIVQQILDVLAEKKIDYCVIGGLAVNAFVEPVVSLDLDLVVVAEAMHDLLIAVEKNFSVVTFPHSINLNSAKSDLRIQIQTDPRYQEFIARAKYKNVLGYKLPVATIEDVLRGKIWAVEDKTRRASKRQKDLSDILRLVERKRKLAARLPRSLKKKLSL